MSSRQYYIWKLSEKRIQPDAKCIVSVHEFVKIALELYAFSKLKEKLDIFWKFKTNNASCWVSMLFREYATLVNW